MSPALPPAPAAQAPVLVALSGGLDSCVLLHWLASSPAQRARGLRAIHVHHGLQADADAWQAHCAALCAALDVPLRCVRVSVARDQGDGLEAAARQARHAAFATELRAGEWLALAHHQDDQAETLLMRALRGSGPDGLAAMRPLRAFGAGQLWRPLLDVPRGALHAHAAAHALRWVEDPSNADDHHDRNFLRLQVLPLLRQRWPHAAAALARSASLAAEAADLLDIEDAAALRRVCDGAALSLDRLREHPAARRARLLRLWVAQAGAPPLPAQGVVALEGELAHHASDREARFAWRDVEVRRWRQALYLLQPLPTWPADWSATWDGTTPLQLPDGGALSLVCNTGTAFAQPLQVRARRGGERIVLPGRQHSHQLKHLLQQADIPPWQRLRMPLLCDGDSVLAAGDQLLSATLQTWLQEHDARLHWQPADRQIRHSPGASGASGI